MEAIMSGDDIGVPAEAHLLDLDDTASGADLGGKVRDSWRDFAGTLGTVLRQLAPGTELDLTLDPTASGTGDAVYAVRIVVGDSGDLVASAVSNAVLPD